MRTGKTDRQGIGTEFTGNRRHLVSVIQSEELHCEGGKNHGDNRTGHPFKMKFGPEENNAHGCQTEGTSDGIKIANMPGEPTQFFKKFPGDGLLTVQTQKIRNLGEHNRDRDPGGKSAGHRPGNELDQGTHAGQPHGDQNAPGHQGGNEQSAKAVFLDD